MWLHQYLKRGTYVFHRLTCQPQSSRSNITIHVPQIDVTPNIHCCVILSVHKHGCGVAIDDERLGVATPTTPAKEGGVSLRNEE